MQAVAPALGAAPESLVARDGRISTADGARSLSFREAASRLPAERISVVASRSDDYGGFARKFGEMAQAKDPLGGVQFAEARKNLRHHFRKGQKSNSITTQGSTKLSLSLPVNAIAREPSYRINVCK